MTPYVVIWNGARRDYLTCAHHDTHEPLVVTPPSPPRDHHRQTYTIVLQSFTPAEPVSLVDVSRRTGLCVSTVRVAVRRGVRSGVLEVAGQRTRTRTREILYRLTGGVHARR